MAASLGFMSRNGLLPTPIDTISFRRISAHTHTHTDQHHSPHLMTSQSTMNAPPSVPLFLLACVHRIRAMAPVQACLTSGVAAWRMNFWFLDVLLLNQISNRSPLSPVDSVRPTSAVWRTNRCFQLRLIRVNATVTRSVWAGLPWRSVCRWTRPDLPPSSWVYWREPTHRTGRCGADISSCRSRWWTRPDGSADPAPSGSPAQTLSQSFKVKAAEVTVISSSLWFTDGFHWITWNWGNLKHEVLQSVISNYHHLWCHHQEVTSHWVRCSGRTLTGDLYLRHILGWRPLPAGRCRGEAETWPCWWRPAGRQAPPPEPRPPPWWGRWAAERIYSSSEWASTGRTTGPSYRPAPPASSGRKRKGQRSVRGSHPTSEVKGHAVSSHPEEGVSVVGQQSVRLGFVFTVKSVETELLLLWTTKTLSVLWTIIIVIIQKEKVSACWATYVSEEAVRDSERMFPAGLQLSEEELTVKVQKFLQVPEDDGSFAPQVLRKVAAVHLREIVMDDVSQRAHVLLLRGDHFLHNVTQLTARTREEQYVKHTLFLLLHIVMEHVLLFYLIIYSVSSLTKFFSSVVDVYRLLLWSNFLHLLQITHLPLGRGSAAGLPLVLGVPGVPGLCPCPAQLWAGVLGQSVWSAASVLLTSRPRMNTPVFPLRTGSLRVRGHGPYRNASGVEGQSKLWVFLRYCRLPEKEEEEEEGEGESRRGRLGLEEQTSTRTEDTSEELLRNRRWRSGVCWGVEVMGEEVRGCGMEALREGEEVLASSMGQEERVEVSETLRSPDGIFLEEVELLIGAGSEQRLWAESRVRIAASIFLSNTFLVSWHLDQAKLHWRRPRSPRSSPAAAFISWKWESGIGGCRLW